MSATQTQTMIPPHPAMLHPFRLKKILLAHDASKAAERALVDATTLAVRFRSEILIVRVQSPEEVPLNGRAHSESEKKYAEAELEEIKDHLTQAGLTCRTIVRMGAIGDTLANLCVEESADLIMLGAYGCGSQDRHTLGSTAEHLLSILPCPAMVYGPSVKFPLVANEHDRPVLFAVSFPLSSGQSEKARQIASYFGVSIEVLHVADTLLPIALHHLEEECKEIASLLNAAGIKSTWCVLSGQPGKVIVRQSSRLACPFVLLPVKYRHIMKADRVAAQVIRTSDVPVLTYSVR
jgi:nucleotide-binding universal stress UspA family protein